MTAIVVALMLVVSLLAVACEKRSDGFATQALPTNTVAFMKFDLSQKAVDATGADVVVANVLGTKVQGSIRSAVIVLLDVEGRHVPVVVFPARSDLDVHQFKNAHKVDDRVVVVSNALPDPVAQAAIADFLKPEKLSLSAVIGQDNVDRLESNLFGMWVSSTSLLKLVGSWTSQTPLKATSIGQLPISIGDGWLVASAKITSPFVDVDVFTERSNAAYGYSTRHQLVRNLPASVTYAFGVAATTDQRWMATVRNEFGDVLDHGRTGEGVVVRDSQGSWAVVATVVESSDKTPAEVDGPRGPLHQRLLEGKLFIAESPELLNDLIRPQNTLGVSSRYLALMANEASQASSVQIVDRTFDAAGEPTDIALTVRSDDVHTHITGRAAL